MFLASTCRAEALAAEIKELQGEMADEFSDQHTISDKLLRCDNYVQKRWCSLISLIVYNISENLIIHACVELKILTRVAVPTHRKKINIPLNTTFDLTENVNISTLNC